MSEDTYNRICSELNRVCSYYLGKPVSRSWKKDVCYKCPQCDSYKFSANEEKRVAHCFKCGWAGNAVQLIQYMENSTVKDALNKGIEILGLPKIEEVTPATHFSRIVKGTSNEELFIPVKHSIYFDIYRFYRNNNQKAIDYYSNKMFGDVNPKHAAIDFIVSNKNLDIVPHLLNKYPIDIIEQCPGFVKFDGKIKFFLDNHIIFPYWESYRRYINAFNGRLKYNPKDNSRYRWIIGERKFLFFPATVMPSNFKIITEGEKKAIVSTIFGFKTIAVSGVECFETGELDEFNLRDRYIYICYDREKENPNVQTAEKKLAEKLYSLGAKPVILNLPTGYKLDDFLFEHGKKSFMELILKGRDDYSDNIYSSSGNESRLETNTG